MGDVEIGQNLIGLVVLLGTAKVRNGTGYKTRVRIHNSSIEPAAVIPSLGGRGVVVDILGGQLDGLVVISDGKFFVGLIGNCLLKEGLGSGG